MNRAALIDQIQQARETLEKLLTLFSRHPSSATDLFLTSISPGGNTGERAKLPEVRQVNRGAILCSRKQGSAPPVTRSRSHRDEYYRLFSPACRTTVVPSLPSIIQRKVAEPSADAIYNAYPDQGPGFYRYVERHSGRRNYYLGRSRSIAAN